MSRDDAASGKCGAPLEIERMPEMLRFQAHGKDHTCVSVSFRPTLSEAACKAFPVGDSSGRQSSVFMAPTYFPFFTEDILTPQAVVNFCPKLAAPWSASSANNGDTSPRYCERRAFMAV